MPTLKTFKSEGWTVPTVGQCATLACSLEAIAPKPGNVHRAADFEDLTFADLLVSAIAIGSAMEAAAGTSLGETILSAVRATSQYVCSNTNLGMILLIAPLATVPSGVPMRDGIPEVLGRLNAQDAEHVYEAIRLANPGGMGAVSKMDVASAAPASLLDAMRDAQARDLIARQYVNNFQQVFDSVVPWLVEGREAGWSLSETIVRTHVRMMAEYPDSLIARKCGAAIAEKSQMYAQKALAAGLPGEEDYERALGDLDFWLRCDGHRRNPGTTADMIAAGLFVAIREGLIAPPWC